MIGQQEYTAVFGSVPGLTRFQAQETWTISHELEWSPVLIQGRTRAFRLLSYRALAKCKPADATMAALLIALAIAGGQRYAGHAAQPARQGGQWWRFFSVPGHHGDGQCQRYAGERGAEDGWIPVWIEAVAPGRNRVREHGGFGQRRAGGSPNPCLSGENHPYTGRRDGIRARRRRGERGRGREFQRRGGRADQGGVCQ